MDYKKTIIKTMFITFASLIGALLIAFLIMFFGFTVPFADLMYDIGCENIASNLYMRSYNKNGNILYCYKAFNLKSKLNQSEDCIALYELMVADDEYEDFIKQCKERNENLNVGVLEKSTLLNEENYIFNCYVKSLLIEGENFKALNCSLDKFEECQNLSLSNFGIYALGQFLDEQSIFEVKYDGFERTLVEEMQEYFNELKLVFDTYKSSENILENAYVVSIGNRIIQLGQDINSIYRSLNKNSDLIESNIDIMRIINDKVKELI